MATTDPTTQGTSRFSTWLPRPLWIGLTTAALVVTGVGVQIGLPIYRKHAAIQEIRRLGGFIDSHRQGAKWLRDRVGDQWMQVFDEPFEISCTEQSTDATMAHLTALRGTESLCLQRGRVT